MSSPKAPGQHRVLPLTDPNHVQEVFAHELTGVQVRNDGTCHFTFSVVRPGHRVPGGIMHNDPDEVRAVTARLIMPLPAVGGMAETLRQLEVAIRQQQSIGQPPKAN